jgi:hypothetical protein
MGLRDLDMGYLSEVQKRTEHKETEGVGEGVSVTWISEKYEDVLGLDRTGSG